MSELLSPLRLNVGFIVHQGIGYSRDFPFDLPQIFLQPDLHLHDLAGVAHITRTPQGLLLQVKIRATHLTECVRCLTEFPEDLETEFTELYAFSHRSTTDSGLLLPDDYQINLIPLVREYMLLAMPISPLCKPDCKGLCPTCGENLNETSCNHQTQDIDPRMAALKSLLSEQSSTKSDRSKR